MASQVTSSNRTSKRYSTYSASPSFSTTISNSTTLVSGSTTYPQQPPYTCGMTTTPCVKITPDVSPEVGLAEIRHLTTGLEKLENKFLEQQRYVPSQKKTDDLSKISLGAKVERALGRRMSNQDAVLRVKRPVKKGGSGFGVIDEKSMLKI
jgi:hypothetical protein